MISEHEVLANIFKQPDLNCNKNNTCKREKFLSRLFGIFSEEIVNIWCQNEQAPFKNLGRPSLYDTKNGKYLHATLDFTFEDREDKKIYIVEMKCEIQYKNFKYFKLLSSSDIADDNANNFLRHHRKKKAFERFEELAKDPHCYTVKYLDSQANEVREKISGIILIWGSVDQEHIEGKKVGKFHQILSVERMISDLQEWDDGNYKELIEMYQCWSNGMFNQLIGNKQT